VKGAQKLGWAHRERLEAVIVSIINTRKHVWRARVVLLSTNGVGTTGIRRGASEGSESFGVVLKSRHELCVRAGITGQTAQYWEDPAGLGVG